MTEKRFMLDDAGELIDKETAQFIEYGEKVCELLNALHEENKKLKDRYYEQSVEYEGLEEQIESLLDFKDKVFNTINGKIKRGETAIDGGRKIGANVGAMGFHIELLKRLKKELEE